MIVRRVSVNNLRSQCTQYLLRRPTHPPLAGHLPQYFHDGTPTVGIRYRRKVRLPEFYNFNPRGTQIVEVITITGRYHCEAGFRFPRHSRCHFGDERSEAVALGAGDEPDDR